MPRLIDAEELKTAFPCGESVRTESVRATIDHMPTVDAIPVVRCKDCKWWNTDEIHKCVAYDAFRITDADDYCAWGERKNGQ
jgi:hypothetical protein